jgi:hypothetical protein
MTGKNVVEPVRERDIESDDGVMTIPTTEQEDKLIEKAKSMVIRKEISSIV